MPDDFQKQQALSQARAQDAREARRKKEREGARQHIKKSNTGRNKGRAKNTMNQMKDMAALATPWGIFSLILQFNPVVDWMYGLAFFAAILKDIFNFTELTGILYILVFIATILCSIFIGMMVLLSGLCEGKNNFSQMRMIRSLLILTLTTVVEIIPGVNFIPFEAISVMFLYAFALQDRKKEAALEKAEKKAEAQRPADGYYSPAQEAA